MDLLPLHPKLVHLPIALAVIVPLVMAGLLAAWWRDVLPRRTWWLAAALQVLLVGSGVAALQSGEADEERVERAVPEAAIEAHEEAAEGFMIGAALVLVIAIAAGVVRGPRAALGLAALASVGSLAVLGLGYRTGEAGGRLVYQHGAAAALGAQAAVGPAGPGAAGAGHDGDDD
jgi:uncharacterized membrane protein